MKLSLLVFLITILICQVLSAEKETKSDVFEGSPMVEEIDRLLNEDKEVKDISKFLTAETEDDKSQELFEDDADNDIGEIENIVEGHQDNFPLF